MSQCSPRSISDLPRQADWVWQTAFFAAKIAAKRFAPLLTYMAADVIFIVAKQRLS
jgi:hypothetical protein